METSQVTPGEQWDRTVAFWMRRIGCERIHCDTFADGWVAGVIVRAHRLFCVGDFVIASVANGQAVRYPVYAVTSKGRKVQRFYLKFQTARYPDFGAYGHRAQDPLRVLKREAWYKSHPSVYFQAGPMHILERTFDRSDELAKLSPADPAIREYVLGTLRTGDAAQRVGSGSPHLFLVPS